MSDPAIPAVQQKKGLGCFATGCLASIGLVILLLLALFGGTYFGVRYLKNNYLATAPVPIPQVEVAPEEVHAVQQRWQQFEASAKAKRKDRIELSAEDINALIANNRRARGKVFVSIVNNIASVQTSFPLDGVKGLDGRYLNGSLSVAATGSAPADAKFNGIRLNNRAVPENLLDWQYRGRSLRSYVDENAGKYDIGTFGIENNKVILETRG